MEIEFEKQKVKLIGLLADFLGVEPSDIKDEDSLTDELHMTPSDLTDFKDILEENGFDTSKIDYNEAETFLEFAEQIIGI